MATALIAARMGSSRLPGKSLMPVFGKPMLERMVERIRHSARISGIVLATSDEDADDPLAQWAHDNDIVCSRGSGQDVLGRLTTAANDSGADVIVEMLGDNPIVHASLIDAALALFEEGDLDYVATLTNEYPRANPTLKRFPVGVRVQVFPVETLRRCAELTSEPRHREHATSFIAENPEIFRTAFVEASGPFGPLNRPELTFAVNHGENLELINRIFAICYREDPRFQIEKAIAAFDADSTLHALMGEPGQN